MIPGSELELVAAAERTAALLARRGRRIVLAESCTAGLVSATLARVPGISAWLCGSAVVYQVETKARWLGIPRALLEDPGPVSPEVAREMAVRVLDTTRQADLAVSVTGHLGPDAPSEQDGLVYACVAGRGAGEGPLVREHRLMPPAAGIDPKDLRIRRQTQAARIVLELVCESLEDQP